MGKSANPKGNKTSGKKKAEISNYIEEIDRIDKSIDTQIDTMTACGDIPDKIFHYTDVNGLFSILNNNTLRMSNLYYLNDSKEYGYGFDIAKKIISDATNDPKTNSIIREFLENYLVFRNKIALASYCVVCFSGIGDRLSQWRAYAGNGAGYSIGFDAKDIDAAESWSLVKVIYEEAAQHQIIRCIVDNYTAYAQSSLRFVAIDGEQDKVLAAFVSFALKLDSEIIRFKHPGFEEEDEYRLVLSRDMSTFSFRPARGMMIPYLDLPGWNKKRDNQIPICEITIGPANNYEYFLVMNSLAALLKSKGYNLDPSDIKQSGIPYRV